jgi:IstB-like ATP binding protein
MPRPPLFCKVWEAPAVTAYIVPTLFDDLLCATNWVQRPGCSVAHRSISSRSHANPSSACHDLPRHRASRNRETRRWTGTSPGVLEIDEVGYLSYDARYADLFFEVITRRYQKNSVIITTNKPFGEWAKVFPNAGCVVTLVDRLIASV